MKKLNDYLKGKCLNNHYNYYLNILNKEESDHFGDLESFFYIASCSKSVFGSIFFNLYLRDSKLLEKKFNQYLGDLGLKNLDLFCFLNHGTNIKDYLHFYDVNHDKNTEEILNEFVRNKEIIKTNFNYSNTNYVVLYDFLVIFFDFDLLLSELNSYFFENFSLLRDEHIRSVQGTPIEGSKNNVHGDGGILFSPNDSTDSKLPFIKYYSELLFKNLSEFKKNAKKVDEDTVYNFGIFLKEEDSESWFYHSGYYNSNIAFWGMNSKKEGFFFCTNFSNLERESISDITGLRF